MNKDIAIIGMAGKFPQASSIVEFGKNLERGLDSVRPISTARMLNTSMPYREDYKDIGYIDDIQGFDHEFFNYSKAEANGMPPHHRLLLEVVYAAFENAGYDPTKFDGSNTSVFVASPALNYMTLTEEYDPTLVVSNLSSSIAGKISRFFNLRGGASMIDTACSSSLVALHYACNDILLGESDCVLVCASDLAIFLPVKSKYEVGINSPDGKARSFSSDANGTGMGESVACVILKSLEKAIQDHDIIHGVIKGSAVNQVGPLSASLAAPDSVAQAEVICKAWEKANVDPDTITFIEAHGTGTKVGDPIEVKGLDLAFQKFTQKKGFCAISSLKSNIGHTGTAAGIAGLIKTVLSLKSKMLFPTLHCKKTNPLIDFQNSSVYVNTELKYWEGNSRGQRRAGISSFGISGTNCHVVIDESPAAPSTASDVPLHPQYAIIPVSAKSSTALTKNIAVLRDFVQENKNIPLELISNTLTTGRAHYKYRYCILAATTEELFRQLSEPSWTEENSGKINSSSINTVFVFSDQADVSWEWMEWFSKAYPSFRTNVAAFSISHPTQSRAVQQLVFQYCFYRLLEELGITSASTIGSGIGRITISLLKNKVSKSEAVDLARAHSPQAPDDLESRLAQLAKKESANGKVVFVEMGPVGDLSGILKKISESQPREAEVICLDQTRETSFLTFLQRLYLSGHPIHWGAFGRHVRGRVELPSYQFDNVRCWLREPTEKAQKNIKSWLYQIAWRKDNKPSPGANFSYKIFLTVMDPYGFGETLIKKIELQEGTCIRLVFSTHYERISDVAYQLDPRDESQFVQLARDLYSGGIEIDGIIDCSGYRPQESSDGDAIEGQLETELYAKLRLIKAFDRNLTVKNFRIAFACCSGASVLHDKEACTPVRSLPPALLRSLLIDYPRLKVNSLDFVFNPAHLNNQADFLLDEITRDELIFSVGYRDTDRYVPTLRKLPAVALNDPGEAAVKPGGVYLVTGGTSGIGVALCDSLSSMAKGVTLIILGRTVLPAEEKYAEWLSDKAESKASKIIRNLMAFKDNGANVEYHGVDVADDGAMDLLFRNISARFSSMDGFIHLAGVVDDLLPFGEKSVTSIRQTLDAKVKGAVVLHQWASVFNPRFIVLFSSLNAVVPHRGTAGYTIANSFLDSFARAHTSARTRVISIAWPGWHEAGESREGTDGSENGINPISTADGLNVFYLAAKGAEGHVLVADVNVDDFAVNPFFSIDANTENISPIAAPSKTAVKIQEQNFSCSETERKILSFWYELLGTDKIELDDDFFDLGGHSLNGTQLLNRIEKEFGIAMEFEDVFEFSTVRKLSAHIDFAANADERENVTENEIPALPERAYYEVTHAQKRLWILDQMEEKQVAYNMTAAYPFEHIHYETLNKAFLILIQRHEILRTSLVLVDGELKQKISPAQASEFRVEYFDIANDPLRFDTAKEIANQDALTHFELDKGPLLRAKLLYLGSTGYVLLFNMHHIISDSWSMEVLRNDLVKIYEALESEGEPSLAPLRIQYRDYAAWQNKQLEDDTSGFHKKYWLSKMDGQIPVLNLPIDYPRPQVKTFHGSNCGFTFEEYVGQALTRATRENDVSPFMLIQSLLFAFLHRYTGSPDIIIGTPITNRRNKELENQIGFFVNTLALRLKLKASDSFAAVVQMAKQNTLEAYEHQVYPFDKLVDDLDLPRDMSRTPLFDVNLVYQTASEGSAGSEFIGIHKSTATDDFNADPKTSIFDLTFDFTWDGKFLLLILKYNTDIFAARTIEKLLVDFYAFAKATLYQPSTPLSEIEFISPAEKTDLLTNFNSHGSTAKVPSGLVVERFEEQVKLYPGRTACTNGEVNWTFKDLDVQADKVAAWIKAQHLANGTVGLLLENSFDLIVAIMGVLKAGAAYLPLDHRSPFERLKFILDDSACGMIIGHSQYMSHANKLLYACKSVKSYLCMDKASIADSIEEPGQLMNVELWDYVGEKATDDISGGGWVSSFTGKPFSRSEMDEYKENTLLKVKPFIKKTSRILEVGCASGITLFAIAPMVDQYVGTDLSAEILKFTASEAEKKGCHNVTLHHLAAHQIDELDQKFDMVIVNSVVQSFPGYNYLYSVIEKSIRLLDSEGVIFFGDLQDLDAKERMVSDLAAFQQKHEGTEFRTKLDWHNELFVSREFLDDLKFDFPEIDQIEHSPKTGSIENELTLYRFDSIINVRKNRTMERKGSRAKHRSSKAELDSLATNAVRYLPNPSDTAYVIYTSGSTGVPKGVEVTVANLSHYANWATAHYLNDDPDHAMALVTSIFFDLTVTSLFCPLLSGAKIVVPLQPEEIDVSLPGVLRNGVDIIKLTPSHVLLFDDLGLQTSSLRAIILGGEPVLEKHIRILRKVNPAIRIFNEYGPTETTVGVTMKEILPDSERATIGTPIAGHVVYVLDDSLNVLPRGVAGELFISGKGVAKGYVNRPEVTAGSFLPNPFSNQIGFETLYKTGDLVKWDEAGELVFQGRKDHQIKIRGHRVEIDEVENRMAQFPFLQDVAVIPVTDAEGHTALHAYFVAGQTTTEKDVRLRLGQSMPSYMVPDRLFRLEKLPLNRNGKVDRKRLAESVIDSSSEEDNLNEIEKKLLEIWRHILEVKSIRAETNFFELGGHSLKATRLVAHIYKAFNLKVNLRDVFGNPTIRSLGKILANTKQGDVERIQPVQQNTHYDLTNAQRRIWILCQINADLVAYNVPGSYVIAGELDREAFEHAFMSLLERHEILRTSFMAIEGEPKQVVNAMNTLSGCITFTDLRDAADQEKRVQALATENGNFIFPLEQAPLIKISIVRLEDNLHLVLFTIHHIISDGWSIGIIVNELTQAYNAFKNKADAHLPPLRIQYKDYSAWVNSHLAKPFFNESRQFWLNLFKDEVPILNLSYRGQRPDVKKFEGERKSVVLEPEANSRLNSFGARHGVTLYTTLLAAIKLILFKYSGQRDIVVGSPVSGRHHVDLENQIGLYLNTLPIRTPLDPQEMLSAFMRRLGDHLLAAFDHQAYPFDLLIEQLNLKPDRSRNPLFDVGFNLSNEIVSPGPTLQGLQIHKVDTGFRSVKTDLWFNMEEHDGQLYISLDYDTALFVPEFINQFLNDFNHLLLILANHREDRTIESLLHFAAQAQLANKRAKQKELQKQNLNTLKQLN